MAKWNDTGLANLPFPPSKPRSVRKLTRGGSMNNHRALLSIPANPVFVTRTDVTRGPV